MCVYISLLVQYRIRLRITTPPVIAFGALNNSSSSVLILWGDLGGKVSDSLGFYK